MGDMSPIKKTRSTSKKPRPRDIKSDIAKRLLWTREILFETQTACALALDVPISTYQHWEKGGRYPDPYILVKYATEYGFTTDWIYRGRLRGIVPDLALRLAAEHPEAVDDDPDMALPAKSKALVS